MLSAHPGQHVVPSVLERMLKASQKREMPVGKEVSIQDCPEGAVHHRAHRNCIPNPIVLPTALAQLERIPGHAAPRRSLRSIPASVPVATVTGKSACFAGWEGVSGQDWGDGDCK